jgi:hypothetical protein
MPGKDNIYVTCIRQANLDAMLGKSPLTIRAHRQESQALLKYTMTIGKTPAYHPRGPFPMCDQVGMSLAVDILLKSLEAKGRIFGSHAVLHTSEDAINLHRELGIFSCLS